MARCLIIGCGCRGRALAAELIGRGHAVRATTRDAGQLEAIEAAGAEALLADPDRVATIAPAFDHVSVACVLLASAAGTPDQLAALHGSRLEMLLLRALDTTVHGIVYEASGSVSPALLHGGAELVRLACEDSRIAYATLGADPRDYDEWLRAASAAVESVLAPGS